MALIYWSADGVGDDVGSVHNAFIRWMRANGSPALIVNGGDIYGDGTDEEFEMFFQQMDRRVADLCETPGNHDWRTRKQSPTTGEIPSAYEAFWGRFKPPLSKQPIDTSKRGGARYEHFIDIDGWRLIFLDTGFCEGNPWPMGDSARTAWLREAVTGMPGRAKIVFAHHSRLSRGKHGDNEEVDTLWQTLFDHTGAPRAALTLAGHDHNVSIYGPRPRTNPKSGSVDFSKGIHIIVNGAGRAGPRLRIPRHEAGRSFRRRQLLCDADHSLERQSGRHRHPRLRSREKTFAGEAAGRAEDAAHSTLTGLSPVETHQPDVRFDDRGGEVQPPSAWREREPGVRVPGMCPT